MTRIRICCLAFLAIWTAVLAAQVPSASFSPDEQTLKQAGIAADAPGLLAYFRQLTPTAAEQATLKLRAVQLGSSIYAVRVKATDDLIRAGRPALPALRAVKKSDNEAARRAQYCIQVIEQHTSESLSATASRVLAERRPDGAAEALLAYLPLVDQAWVEEDIRHSLKQLAAADARAQAALTARLTDKETKPRAAAAWVLGASTDAEVRRKVVPLLKDESAAVRFLAASSLLGAHESAAVPTLISLLTADPELAWHAEDLLFRLADDKGPAVWLGFSNDNNGARVRAAWEAWWKENHAKIDWPSLKLEDQALGLTLVVENQRPGGGGGRVYECNKNGDIRWQHKVHNPIDAQWLPGGRLLVGDSRSSLIFEIDAHGVIGWKIPGISPTSVQRLPNGNTVVSTYQQILELTRDNKTVFSFTTPGHTYHARKLPDGHYIWIDASGEIGEVDAKGTALAKTKLGGGLSWGSIERLRNGHYLVALGGSPGKIQEVDMKGKVYWEKSVSNPNRAARLANGHTLVASHADQCIYEFDAAGNQRWKHSVTGRPFAALRR